MKHRQSHNLFKQANKYLVGGVNSPVRAYKAVGGCPIFIKKGKGSKIYDADNNRYIDYVMSWGALILGHAPAAVLKAVKQTVNSGMSFGAPTENEIKLAKIISCAIPSIEKLRLVNSGTEATMSAIRLARGFTGKNKVIKFEGCYHGHSDSLLVKAGSGLATFGIPDSLGVPESVSRDTLVLPYNDIDATSRIIKDRYKEIACIIVEPVAANMGVVLPKIGFLQGLRELTAKYKIVLIFDEVICGFRFTFGGVQSLYGIKPDLTCLGKIIGGGMPLAAYGGKREIMDKLSPLGGVYQAGTLSGNPVAVSAGIATLEELSKLDYVKLNKTTINLCEGLQDILRVNKSRFSINRAGSMFTIFFTEGKVYDLRSAKSAHTKKYSRYFWSMVKQGINLPPSQFEGNFVSFAHSEQDINSTVKAFSKAVKIL
jgi:glutamate-1-semialdehyde 2,1-aminomutase